MNFEIKYPVVLAALYLWIGFVCAISFMEAWLKFRAPGVNLPIGLGIGRLVFKALNRVEWFFTLTIIVSLVVSNHHFFSFSTISLYIPVILLVLQTVWLLPALDARAQLHIDGKNVPASNLHFYYVAFEIVKISCLFIYSVKLCNPFTV